MENEIWKDIPGYEGLYQVSNLGKVKSLDRKKFYKDGRIGKSKGRILKTRLQYGYVELNLSKQGKQEKFKVHKLVAIAFLNHKPCGHKLVINHKDFNRANNNIKNLEIISNRENTNKKHLKSSSEYTGVFWYKRKKKWACCITIKKKKVHLGYFTNEYDANLAYQKALRDFLKGREA